MPCIVLQTQGVMDSENIEVPEALAHMRRVPWDSSLLLFDRETGWNALIESEATRDLRMLAPRAVQFGITNGCNLACTFCSRDLDARSTWTVESAFAILRDLSESGVLEVALGGGEPFAFRGLSDLVSRIYDETPLAIGITTNGLLCDARKIASIARKLSQIRLSVYDDNDWRKTLDLLDASGARWGINYLLTPERLPLLEATVLEFVDRGCRDVLLLSYNGHNRSMHLTPTQADDAARRIRALARGLENRCALKLDVCWGERMDTVPQLFEGERPGCGAGREFVVITSDRRLMPCSFHHLSFPIETAGDVLAIWRNERDALAARDPGCARTPAFGLAKRTLEMLP